jgi:hypothetical protein
MPGPSRAARGGGARIGPARFCQQTGLNLLFQCPAINQGVKRWPVIIADGDEQRVHISRRIQLRHGGAGRQGQGGDGDQQQAHGGTSLRARSRFYRQTVAGSRRL